MPTLKIEIPKPDARGFATSSKIITKSLAAMEAQIKKTDVAAIALAKRLKTLQKSRGQGGRSSISRTSSRGGGGDSVGGASALRGVGRLVPSIGRIGIAAGAAAGGVALLGIGLTALVKIGKATIPVFIAFEDRLVDTGRILNLRGRELDEFGKTFQELAGVIPIATNQLLAFAGLAARFGVQGSKSIEAFTLTAGQLNLVLGTSNEQLQQLAQIANLTNFPIDEIGKFGNALAVLDQSLPTTAGQILTVAQRISQATQQFKFSAQQVLAFSSTLAAAGLRGELVGTAIGKLSRGIAKLEGQGISDLLAGLDVDSNGLRLTREEFERLRVLDPADLLRRIATQSLNTSQTLATLGVNNDRVIQAFDILNQRADELNKSFRSVNKEFERTTTLERQAAERTQTLSSQIKILGNNFTTALTSVGKFGVELIGLDTIIKELNGTFEKFNIVQNSIKNITNSSFDVFSRLTGSTETDEVTQRFKDRERLENAAVQRGIQLQKVNVRERKRLEDAIFRDSIQNLSELDRNIEEINRKRQDELANIRLLTTEEEKRLQAIIARAKANKDDNVALQRANQIAKIQKDAADIVRLINARARVDAESALERQRPTAVPTIETITDETQALTVTNRIAQGGEADELIQKENQRILLEINRNISRGNTLTRQQLDAERNETTFEYVPN